MAILAWLECVFLCHSFVQDPCTKYKNNKTRGRAVLFSELYEEDTFMLLANGSVYLPHDNRIFDIDDYCFGLIEEEKYTVICCFVKINWTEQANLTDEEIPIAYRVGLMISIPSFLVSYFFYTVLQFWLQSKTYSWHYGYICPLASYEQRFRIGSIKVSLDKITFWLIFPPGQPVSITDDRNWIRNSEKSYSSWYDLIQSQKEKFQTKSNSRNFFSKIFSDGVVMKNF